MASKRALVWNFLGGLFSPLVVWTYENVALHKTAWQTNQYLNDAFNASLAVDGKKTNLSIWECVVSSYGKTAEWRVDLNGVLSIHHILIQYAQNNPVWDKDDYQTSSFLGFSLYISNTTSKEDGVLCFRDTNYTESTIPNPVYITCAYHGRYVIYYNNRTHKPYPEGYSNYAYTDLCEVEVFGCSSPGVYGANCSIICPHNCQEGHCNIVEGTCLGCLPGYRGVTCNEECQQFTYGLECKQVCGNCSRGDQCNHVNGSCLNGCDVGVYGDKCDKECPQSKFGQNCQHNCSIHCFSSGMCDPVKGYCLGGCQAGWKNAQCDQECDGRTFGQNCSQSCGKCLNNEQCDPINGSCLNGCDSGYRGTNCKEECVVGLYGANCEEFCSSNCKKSGLCDKVTGHCDGGCQAGWKNAQCDQECDGRTFGQICSQICGKCLNNEQCHQINGRCLNGCVSGYGGTNCTEECDVGLYGANCEGVCSPNCIKPGICDKVTGYCDGGCQDGWTQMKCDSDCPPGFYGQDCKENCSTNCIVPVRCDRMTGQCEGGCQAGWTQSKCDSKTVSPTHGQEDHGIPISVTATILIAAFVIAVVVFLFIGRRRWQLQSNHIETTTPKRQRDRTVNDDPMTNNSQEYDVSTLNTNAIHSYEEEIIPELESKNVLIKRPEENEGCLAKEHIASDNQDDKCSITDTYDLCNENTPDILVSQLHETIVEMTKHKNESFKREYSMLSKGELFPCNVGKRKENLSKNRYKTTLPYDHSRVILHRESGCPEYINASFIENMDRKIAYIATQGPKENTVNDFWRMVWQENVSQIIMLTNIMEGGKIKCFQYWPDCSNTELYGNVTIENVSDKHYAFYITRKFVLSHKPHQMSRDIMQYHYTMWPDHGTPGPLNLAVFHSEVLRTSTDENTTPLVVHCSAGIGRTGTFIALDALFKEGEKTGKINVAKYVKIMRSCRMNMVQNYEQYMTIFTALNERFKASHQRQSLSTFVDTVDSVLRSPQKQTCIEREFEKRLHIRPEYTLDDYSEATQLMNRKDAVLPRKFVVRAVVSKGKLKGIL
uniref:protein-tyrosine-phosphatase n=1 Tax=Crassostrea virginica TaxID=6565 RepID=A0A8B8BY03_CRAVI|nr:uncharacterized protein LOC111113736 [Crassostrea virginica]